MSLKPLEKYLPEGSLGYVEQVFSKHAVVIKITNPRLSRLGSFSAKRNGKPSTINISGSLNPYFFLLTLMHELAHLKIYEAYRNKVQPHGKEWKSMYKFLIQPLLAKDVFPKELMPLLVNHFQNPKASTSSDPALYKALRGFNPGEESIITVEDLGRDERFLWRQRVFQRKEKLRKRYKCVDVKNRKEYLFSPLAEVVPLRS